MNHSPPRLFSRLACRITDGVRWARTKLAGQAGSPRRRTPSFFPQLEQLDLRVLLSVNPASVGVSDYRYGTFDQGVDSSETLLTPANVKSDFGRLWNTPGIEGQIYAQPVLLPNFAVTVNGTTTTQNTLIVGTEMNMLYWLNADTGAVLRSLDLNQFGIAGATVTPVPSADVGTGTTDTQVYPWIGILSTPAYDASTGMLYVVAYKKEVVPGQTMAHYVFDLEQINAATGDVTQATIADTGYDGSNITYFAGSPVVQGNGTGSVNGTLTFDARLEGQRPAVTLVTDTAGNKGLLIGFEGHDDTGNYHGWEITISTTTLQVNGVFCITPNGAQGGAWRAPIADDQGNIWVVSGNGTFDTQLSANGMPAGGDFGDSVIHLQYTPQGLQPVDYFTPSNQQFLSDNDLDLDAGGLVMLPSEAGLISVGKDGSIYYLNPANLGGFHSAKDQPVQELLNVLPSPTADGSAFTEPTFFNNTLYVSVQNGHAYAFSVAPNTAQPLSLQPTQINKSVFGYPGVTDTVSANGTTDGIIWTLNAVTGLQAYDVSAGLGSVLYASTQDPARDHAPPYVKFTVPVVYGGMVYVAGNGDVAAYGLLSGSGATPSAPTNLAVTTAGPNSLDISWTPGTNPSVGPTTAYIVQMAGPGFGNYFQTVATVYGGTTSATISGLLPSTGYRFQVVAQNAAGDSPPSGPAGGTTAKSGSVASAIPGGVSASTANLVIGWYQQFMARTPLPTEVFAWAQALDSGSLTPAAAALAMATSVECDTYQVTQLYERYLNRAPDAEGLQGWVNLMQSGASLQAVAAGILGSDEYNARAGGSAFALVNSLYQNLLGRTALGTELSVWLNSLAQGETRAQVAAGFLSSAEFVQKEVDQFYSQWLNRQPEPSGLAAWEGAFANGLSDEQAAAGFGASAEFMSDQQQ
jgi:hypothetical protein